MYIESVKGRQLRVGDVVDVYYNLHRHVFSIRNVETGLVVAHGNGIKLYGPVFRTSQAGRERVIREQRKNVHAVVRGMYGGISDIVPEVTTEVKYNPYTHHCFYVDCGIHKMDANYEEFGAALLYNKRMHGYG